MYCSVVSPFLSSYHCDSGFSAFLASTPARSVSASSPVISAMRWAACPQGDHDVSRRDGAPIQSNLGSSASIGVEDGITR